MKRYYAVSKWRSVKIVMAAKRGFETRCYELKGVSRLCWNKKCGKTSYCELMEGQQTLLLTKGGDKNCYKLMEWVLVDTVQTCDGGKNYIMVANGGLGETVLRLLGAKYTQ